MSHDDISLKEGLAQMVDSDATRGDRKLGL